MLFARCQITDARFWDRLYKAVGYLEGGGRDCTAWLLVPRNACQIELTSETLLGDLDSEYLPCGNTKTINVTLPKYSFLEGVSGGVGASPTAIEAAGQNVVPGVMLLQQGE